MLGERSSGGKTPLNRKNQLSLIKIRLFESHSAVGIDRRLAKTLGKAALSENTVRKCFKIGDWSAWVLKTSEEMTSYWSPNAAIDEQYFARRPLSSKTGTLLVTWYRLTHNLDTENAQIK